MQTQKGVASVILVVVIVALVAVAGYFAYQYFLKSQGPNPNAQPNPNTQNLNTETAGLPVQSQQATEGWKTYINTEKGFSIKYPYTWKVQEFSCNIDGVEFCPPETQSSSLGVCGIRCSDSDKGYISIATEGDVTASSLNLWDQNYKEIYDQMLSTFKFTK